jgi:uncharacterized membrane protein
MVSKASDGGEQSEQLRDLLDLASIAVAVGLIGLVVSGDSGVTRVVLALVFTFFVPGRAVVTNWPRLAYWSEIGMSMILSLVMLILVATIALWAHEWHPTGLFQGEAVLSLIALGAGVARRHRRIGDRTGE